MLSQSRRHSLCENISRPGFCGAWSLAVLIFKLSMLLRTFGYRLSFLQICLLIYVFLELRDGGFAYSVSCKLNETKYALIDGRVKPENPCRVRCENSDNAGITTEDVKVPCAIGDQASMYEFQIPDKLCLPRGVCIKYCGEEQPGCVYTGDCRSQTCFRDSNMGDPANLTRITHTGHGSIVETVSGRTLEERERMLPEMEREWTEGCILYEGSKNKFFRTTYDCDGKHPLVDNQNDIGGDAPQCRSLCLRYDNPEMEINLVHFSCPYCYSQDFLSYRYSSAQVCVPHEVCEKECGPPGPGCVYSGTCKTQFCFSGIDSKKPATIEMTSARGEDISITIDNTLNNSRPNVPKDPPVFGRMRFSIDSGGHLPAPQISQTPSPRPGPRESSDPKPQPNPSTPSPSPPASSDEGQSNLKSQDGDRESRWVWLGPLLGLVLAAMIGFAGTVVSAIIRNRAPPQGDQSTINEEYMDHLR